MRTQYLVLPLPECAEDHNPGPWVGAIRAYSVYDLFWTLDEDGLNPYSMMFRPIPRRANRTVCVSPDRDGWLTFPSGMIYAGTDAVAVPVKPAP